MLHLALVASTLASAGSLVLDGVPDIPAELSEELEPWLDTRSAALSALSPDGTSMLVLTRFGESEQVHLVREPGGDRTQLTFGEEPATSAAMLGDGVIAYAIDEGGDEKYQVWRLDTRTGARERLTDGVSRHSYVAWAPSGQRVAYSGNARNGRDMDLYVWEGGASRRIADVDGDWGTVDWSPDERRLLVRQYVSVSSSALHVVDVETGAVTALTGLDAASLTGRFAPDGDGFFVLSDRGGEHAGLWRVSEDGSAWTPLTAELGWDVEAFDVAADGTIAYVANEDGYGRLHVIDRKGRDAVVPIPDGLVGSLRFARDERVLGFTLSGPTRTADAWTLDLRRKGAPPVQWTHSEIGGLDASRFVAPELVRFPTFDGASAPGGEGVPAFVYRPAGPGPHPVVIRIHGGPESQSRPGFDATLQHLVVERGYAVIVPNVRGSTGYGRTWRSLDDGALREDSVKDIGALLDWIATRPDLDASRVAVTGGSYGGYMVLASLIHFGDRLKAGVDRVGIANFVTFLENTSAYRRDLRRAEYGDERVPEMRELLLRISPTTHADRIRSALFVIHGANDPRVPLSEATQIVEAVRARGQDVWSLVATDEGHGFKKKSNVDVQTALVVMFLDQHLAPDPS